MGQVEKLVRIGSEEVGTLEDIESRCFFEDVKERVEFRLAVCKHAGCDHYEAIDEDSFEQCYEAAMELLRNRGRKVFTKRAA